ncbi:MAG: bifunctional 4-hydroxy-2-oxoglutarate aldolase/2-dehydro-3-deoxy-phosphogluconate aldolase [Lachnospiraceae bacterium]|nr:bifunctional 4-hydroxy-2-oxoglutarate aldolase/2-dehydro-3-deoxy-phosphogluconate aldolase [Lachnospiraceae bacterium]
MDVLKRIENYGVIPVVKIEKPEQALPLAKALCEGELEAAEITFRTDCAEEAIAAIRREYPGMLLGAGTVTTVEQAKAAVKAGADFIVSPCFVEEVVKYCVENGICVMPGCGTATEVQMAVSCGLKAVKFFPAEAAGGIAYINSLASVFKGVKFMPTGGVKPSNMRDYLMNPNVIACGGTWIVPSALLNAGEYEEIRKLARDAVFGVLNFSFAHVGINVDKVRAGYEAIFRLADTFDLILGNTRSSSYVGHEVEITKQPFKVRTEHGHLGYFTDNLERAIFYLEKKGIEFNYDSVKPWKDKPYVIYLKEDLAGFAIHIEERNDHNPPKWEHRDEVKQYAPAEIEEREALGE